MRWADLDMLGHVNNVVYVDYLQEARVDMLRVHARSPQTQGLAEGVVVVSHQVTYVAPLLFDFGPVYVETWVTEIRAASFTLAYEVFRERDGERTVHLRASTVLTPYVFATETPRRLTQAERDNLAPYLEPGPAAKTPFGPPRHTEMGHFPVKVRFSDVDVYGHVNNVKYFEYLQEGRVAAIGKMAMHLGERRPTMVVAQTDLAYRIPMLMRPEPYDLYTWAARVGGRSLTLEAEIVDPIAADPTAALARGRVVMVFFDPETGRSVEPTPEVRRALEAL